MFPSWDFGPDFDKDMDGDIVNHLMLGNNDCIMVADIAIGLQLPPLLAVYPR